ncbi:hypothetical protein F6X42_37225 [Paraburkholderia sp. WC7.3b]|uniref:DUF7673 domain-containing protein n=1 Tax=Paraburkholderia podalyriae TaxID=1938811 RepID=A0ABR7Q045_9BURK|nr:hypothetical protein [Paraburkholderia podalyriae]
MRNCAEDIAPAEKRVLENLLAIAAGNTGQSRRVADCLLAWWNPGSCGSYDLTTAWGCDVEIVEDMITVFGLASRAHSYPDTRAYEEQFKAVSRAPPAGHDSSAT